MLPMSKCEKSKIYINHRIPLPKTKRIGKSKKRIDVRMTDEDDAMTLKWQKS